MRRFRFGENMYLSNREVKFQIVTKMGNINYIKREVVANVIDKDEELIFMWIENITNVEYSNVL